MRCPECGKEIKNNEVCTFIFDDKGEPIFSYHVNKEVHASFLQACRERGGDPKKVLFKFMDTFNRYVENRKYSEKEILQIINKIVLELMEEEGF